MTVYKPDPNRRLALSRILIYTLGIAQSYKVKIPGLDLLPSLSQTMSIVHVDRYFVQLIVKMAKRATYDISFKLKAVEYTCMHQR